MVRKGRPSLSAVQVGTLPTLTHLYGPAVRCKPNVNKWTVLRICIRPLHGAFVRSWPSCASVKALVDHSRAANDKPLIVVVKK